MPWSAGFEVRSKVLCHLWERTYLLTSSRRTQQQWLRVRCMAQ